MAFRSREEYETWKARRPKRTRESRLPASSLDTTFLGEDVRRSIEEGTPGSFEWVESNEQFETT